MMTGWAGAGKGARNPIARAAQPGQRRRVVLFGFIRSVCWVELMFSPLINAQFQIQKRKLALRATRTGLKMRCPLVFQSDAEARVQTLGVRASAPGMKGIMAQELRGDRQLPPWKTGRNTVSAGFKFAKEPRAGMNPI